MKPSLKLDTLSHHAYCLIGSESVHAELFSILEKKQKIKIHGNPDFFDRGYETFTIDDARGIKSLAETKPISDSNNGKDDGAGKKIFVLMMNGITVEAQNALLKLLEEPPVYAHFFLIIPSAHLLLPTVKSRLSMIRNTSWGGKDTSKTSTIVDYSDSEVMKQAEAFLKALPTKRLEIIKSLMDSISKEKKTKQDAIDLINAIEAAAYSKVGETGVAAGLKKNAQALEAIAVARKYMNDRSPSMKMLLEYVALNV